MHRRSCFRAALYVMTPMAFVFLTGCTPEEEQMIRDSINSIVQNVVSNGVTFVFDFARQVLAAFLL